MSQGRYTPPRFAPVEVWKVFLEPPSILKTRGLSGRTFRAHPLRIRPRHRRSQGTRSQPICFEILLQLKIQDFLPAHPEKDPPCAGQFCLRSLVPLVAKLSPYFCLFLSA